MKARTTATFTKAVAPKNNSTAQPAFKIPLVSTEPKERREMLALQTDDTHARRRHMYRQTGAAVRAAIAVAEEAAARAAAAAEDIPVWPNAAECSRSA